MIACGRRRVALNRFSNCVLCVMRHCRIQDLHSTPSFFAAACASAAAKLVIVSSDQGNDEAQIRIRAFFVQIDDPPKTIGFAAPEAKSLRCAISRLPR